jgi:hypothetical protein
MTELKPIRKKKHCRFRLPVIRREVCVHGYNNDKTMMDMADETTVQGRGATSSLVDATARIGQLQVEMMAGAFKAVLALLVPLSRASVDLSLSMLKTFSRVMDGVTTALVPKRQV